MVEISPARSALISSTDSRRPNRPAAILAETSSAVFDPHIRRDQKFFKALKHRVVQDTRLDGLRRPLAHQTGQEAWPSGGLGGLSLCRQNRLMHNLLVHRAIAGFGFRFRFRLNLRLRLRLGRGLGRQRGFNRRRWCMWPIRQSGIRAVIRPHWLPPHSLFCNWLRDIRGFGHRFLATVVYNRFQTFLDFGGRFEKAVLQFPEKRTWAFHLGSFLLA